MTGTSASTPRAAKAINVGLIYGMSAFGLGRQLGIERGAAQEYIDRYFARYAGVGAYMERTIAEARATGVVSTLLGRRRLSAGVSSRFRRISDRRDSSAHHHVEEIGKLVDDLPRLNGKRDAVPGRTTTWTVEADGNVVITTPEEVARGREGVYNADKGTATLTGDVRITRGENQLNGERAVVNLNTGVSRLLPAAKGERVKGLFTPGTAPQFPATWQARCRLTRR